MNNRNSSLLCALFILSGLSFDMQALNTVYKVSIATAALIAGRLYSKGANPNRITTDTYADALCDATAAIKENNVSKAISILSQIFDDIVIGYRGTADGLVVGGPVIYMRGKDMPETQLIDGQEIKFFLRKRVSPYGFFGNMAFSVREFAEGFEFIGKTAANIGGVYGAMCAYEKFFAERAAASAA